MIEESRLPARRAFASSRAVAAALLADDEQQADARLAVAPQPLGRRDLRGQNALGVARAAAVQPIAVDAAREKRRHAVEVRREHDRPGGVRTGVAITLNRVVVHRLLVTANPSSRRYAGEPAARFAFAAGRRIDVDERARERDVLPDPRFELRARVGPRVAVFDDDRRREREAPLRAPCRRVTARAPGTTTAPSGTTSGRSAVGLMISPWTRSYTGVDPVSTVPAAMTARALMTAPS